MKNATKATAFRFLRINSMAVLATLSKSGAVSTSPVTYVVTDDNKLRFITRDRTGKFLDMVDNPHVALSIVSEEVAEAVNITATVSIVDNVDELNRTLRDIGKMNNKRKVHPIIQHQRGDFVLIEVEPKRIQYTNYSDKPVSDYEKKIYDL